MFFIIEGGEYDEIDELSIFRDFDGDEGERRFGVARFERVGEELNDLFRCFDAWGEVACAELEWGCFFYFSGAEVEESIGVIGQVEGGNRDFAGR